MPLTEDRQPVGARCACGGDPSLGERVGAWCAAGSSAPSQACSFQDAADRRAGPATATQLALRSLARRYQQLSAEIADLDELLDALLAAISLRLTVHGVGAGTSRRSPGPWPGHRPMLAVAWPVWIP
ncbi:hypothetical protein ABT158_30975 [Nonomuraea sp. NPDC001636]|uniref:hypothetical protein n=1 Tax=Nonomuraea sp. NPDC001636 TaxID=3154391 RepID=UPI00331D54BE